MILTRVETGDDRSFVLSFCASCHAIEVHVISTKMFSLVSVRKACRLIPAFLFLIFVAASSRTATGGASYLGPRASFSFWSGLFCSNWPSMLAKRGELCCKGGVPFLTHFCAIHFLDFRNSF